MKLKIKAKPNSRLSSLVQQTDGSWLAHLKAPPVDGKANAELINLIAQYFNCRKSAVVIRSGNLGKIKLVEIIA